MYTTLTWNLKVLLSPYSSWIFDLEPHESRSEVHGPSSSRAVVKLYDRVEQQTRAARVKNALMPVFHEGLELVLGYLLPCFAFKDGQNQIGRAHV